MPNFEENLYSGDNEDAIAETLKHGDVSESTMGPNFDFEKLDRIYETLNKFEEDRESEEICEEWVNNYWGKQAEFSNAENIKKLKEIPSHKRLIMLARTSDYLTYTPALAKKYFEEFPEDLDVIKHMFNDCRGFTDNVLAHQLFTISGFELESLYSNNSGQSELEMLNNYRQIAERRNNAPAALLDNFEYNYSDSFKEFGKGAEGFLKSIDEAGKLILSRIGIGENYCIDPEKIFTQEYELMSEEQKASFLRKAIAELQFSLVYEETFNSRFSKESVSRDNKASNKEGREHYNARHSILFKTYQPVSVYDRDQKYFKDIMNAGVMVGGFLEEYPYHRLLLAILNRIKGVKAEKDLNTDVLVDFWNKNRNPIFGHAVTEALINQNIGRAAGNLLELLDKEKTDRNPLTAILYRLEFGRIGISEAGVDYLGKMYNLGELNNPDYFAQRLTAKGDIGIFDDKRILQNYFNLGNLGGGEKTIKPVINDFVYKTLFFEKEGESQAERQKREQYLKEFKENYFNFYDEDFFKETGIRFNNLDFREQGWFLIHYKNADAARKDELLVFAKEHEERGLKTFLAMEHGESNGDKIIKIGKHLDSLAAGLIFQKYNEITDMGRRNASELAEIFKNKRKLTNGETEQIASNTIYKANSLLELFAKTIDESESKEEILSNDDIMDALIDYKSDLIFTAGVYKAIKETNADISPEDMKGIVFEQATADQINDSDKKRMIEIYRKNYESRPNLQKELIQAFEEKMSTGRNKVRIYMYKKDGDVVAFNRIDDEAGGKIFASLNVSDTIKQLCFGGALSKASVSREMSNDQSVIRAVCNPELRLTAFYVEQVGFVGKGITRNYKNTGETAFNIEINPAKQNYYYRNYTVPEIISEYEEKFSGGRKAEAKEKIILRLPENSRELTDSFEKLINNDGFVMTRYIFSESEQDRGFVYCAFEKEPS